MDLQAIYLTTLERCAPDILVKKCIASMERDTLPRNVVAIGKCAGALLDGVAAVFDIEHAFAAIPEGYPLPRTRADVHLGGHPHMTAASFAAGQALLDFVDHHDDLLFLVSGGGSACVEVALRSEEETAAVNDRLIASGLPIAAINAERRAFSAIKGGKLRVRVRGRCRTLVYSDVSPGALADVASGPTLTTASEATLIADNATLTRAAAHRIGAAAVVIESPLEADVEEAAEFLARRADQLRSGQILVAGGEPTVVVQGDGRGGRCSELAVRFAMRSPFEALFGSSDGVDGNSGVAGIHLPRRQTVADSASCRAALLRSASYEIAAQLGEPIMITPTGNNLRDLVFVARD